MTLMLSQCVPFALSMFLLAIPAHDIRGLHAPTGSSGECGGEPVTRMPRTGVATLRLAPLRG